MTDLRAGADAILLRLNDLKWQELREAIEGYGRDCYNAGAKALLDRLEAEIPKECPECGDPDCTAARNVGSLSGDADVYGSPGRCT